MQLTISCSVNSKEDANFDIRKRLRRSKWLGKLNLRSLQTESRSSNYFGNFWPCGDNLDRIGRLAWLLYRKERAMHHCIRTPDMHRLRSFFFRAWFCESPYSVNLACRSSKPKFPRSLPRFCLRRLVLSAPKISEYP